MITIFVSCAPSDTELAVELAEALRREGIDPPFVPRPHASINWQEALQMATVECRAVLALITARWLAPDGTGLDDLRAAAALGKRVVGVALIDERRLDPVAAERLAAVRDEGWVIAQGAEAQPRPAQKSPGSDGSLSVRTADLGLPLDAPAREALFEALRAAGADSAAGPDPACFAVDRTRRPAPFVGLAPFEDDEADAAIFFGRGREIAEVMERLRAHRAARHHPPVAIVGPAGVGKTSLLQAGVLPRLRREAPAWVVLRPVRLEGDPLFSLADAIIGTLADFDTPGDAQRLTDALMSLWSTGRGVDGRLTDVARDNLGARLAAEAERLRAAAGRPQATLLLAVGRIPEPGSAGADNERAQATFDYLAAAAQLDGVQVLLTIDAPALEAVQAWPGFEAVTIEPYPLRPIPAFRFDEVVAGPAARYGATVSPRVSNDLVTEAAAPDELPLLAWGLAHLWADGTLASDRAPPPGGWLTARIEAVAEEALADADDPLARATFVPHLVRLDASGVVTAPGAAWADIRAEGRALLERFMAAGLARRDGAAVFIALAPMRRWSRLQAWLAPERTRLDARQALRRAAEAWHQNGRRDDDLKHGGERLAAARTQTATEVLSHFEQDYLRDCEARDRTARRQRWTSRLMLSAVVVALFALGAWWAISTPAPSSAAAFAVAPLTTAQEAALSPGDIFTECNFDCPKMVVVPAGRFVMGDERRKEGSALPQHEVTIARPFAVSQTEITIAEMIRVCDLAPDCHLTLPEELDVRKPHAESSWRQARTYVLNLSTITGRRYRLLSEAEWEYVARATSTTAYPWGDDIGVGRAHCSECGVALSPHYFQWNSYLNRAAPVASYAPNAFGLYDTVGNQWEVVDDCWHPSYAGAPNDGSPWMEEDGGDCDLAVIRGGSMVASADNVRSSVREATKRSADISMVGFRVARDLGPLLPSGRSIPTPLSAAKESRLLPGDAFAECTMGCPSMVVIPAGRLIAAEGEPAPPNIPEPFAVSRTEITIGHGIAACRWSPACPTEVLQRLVDAQRKLSHRAAASDWPPEFVDGYLRWLAWTTGKRYRRVTDAEWAFIAQGGREPDAPSEAPPPPRTAGALVAMSAPNPFGVYDTERPTVDETSTNGGLRVARDLVRIPPPVAAVTPTPLPATEEHALLPGDTFTECEANCPQMVVVPSGSFLMGDEQLQRRSALPRHRVTIARPFAVGRTEVTYEQVEALCKDTGSCELPPGGRQRLSKLGRAPVNYLSRDGAAAYVAWLRKKTGRPYRLLSEAEWAYAARANSQNAYTWGETFRPGWAFCKECGTAASPTAELGAKVGSFAPNAFDLFDVHGNLWEIVDDCWHDSFVGAPSDGSSWRGDSEGQCEEMVLRGGGLDEVPRLSMRDHLPAYNSVFFAGVRVARDLATAPPMTERPRVTEAQLRTTSFAPFILSDREEAQLFPGDVFRECKADCPSMVVIPAGAFTMGDEGDREASARPRHRVVLARPFAVGRTEVTIAQVDLCKRAGACAGVHLDVDGRLPQGWASYADAQSYVAWLQRMTGQPYRLLSEAEWEYVARAGTETRYWWGDDVGVGRAQCEACNPNFYAHVAFVANDRMTTAPVGWFTANPFGLFEVHGNLWEVVQDCWHDSYAGAPTDGSPWMEENNGDCTRMVLRGGGFQGTPEGLGAMVRDRLSRGVIRPAIGLRVARDLPHLAHPK